MGPEACDALTSSQSGLEDDEDILCEEAVEKQRLDKVLEDRVTLYTVTCKETRKLKNRAIKDCDEAATLSGTQPDDAAPFLPEDHVVRQELVAAHTRKKKVLSLIINLGDSLALCDGPAVEITADLEKKMAAGDHAEENDEDQSNQYSEIEHGEYDPGKDYWEGDDGSSSG